jgi:hypothetical protein
MSSPDALAIAGEVLLPGQDGYDPAAAAAVKRRYDPGNVSRRNHNIRPERADAVSAGSSTATSAGA